MNNKHQGLLNAIKILSIVFTSLSFLTGVFLAIICSYRSNYNSGYGYTTSFQAGVFMIILAILIFYMAIPVILTIMSSSIGKNKRLILPSFIMALAVMPVGGYLGLTSLFSSTLGGTTIGTMTGSTGWNSFVVLSLVFFILFVMVAITLLIMLTACLMTDKPENNSVDHEDKNRIINELVSNSSGDLSKSFEAIKKAKELYDSGVLSEEEFKAIKAKLL